VVIFVECCCSTGLHKAAAIGLSAPNRSSNNGTEDMFGEDTGISGGGGRGEEFAREERGVGKLMDEVLKRPRVPSIDAKEG